jgi:cell division protein FtsB
VLNIPRTIRLRVPAAEAIRSISGQIDHAEPFLIAAYTAGVYPRLKRDVWRWQAENEALIDRILERATDSPSSSGDAEPAADDERVRFMWLQDEVAQDVAELSALVVRLGGAPGGKSSSSRPGSGADPGPTAKVAPLPEHSKSEERLVVDSSHDPDFLSPEEHEVVPAHPVAIGSRHDSADDGEPVDGPEPAGSAIARSLVLLADPASAALPQYDADAVSTRDLIGNDEIVDAFAYLIAATALQPPLAIGLFGHWGTGKSFLMRSIQRRIDDITRGARESGRRQADIGVYQRVVQIEFNAWHYVEGNLWASMVDHILSNLRTSSEEKTSDLDRRRHEVTKSLASTRQEEQALSQRIDTLNQERDAVQTRAKKICDRQQEQLQEIGRLRLKDVAVAATLTQDDQKALTDALTRVGVPGGAQSAADAASSLADARQVVQRGNLLVAPMRQYGWWWAALLVLVVLIAPATAFLLESLDTSAITQVLTAIAGFLSAAALVIRRSTGWAGRALDKIEAAERQVRARVEEAADQQAAQMAAYEQEIADLERQLSDELRRRDDVTSEIRTLSEELDNLTPGKLLASFLDERAASSDYRKHLGLTALVRRDFEELSRLVGAYNEEALRADATSTTGHPTQFNRIVLYIDDLDRCPPHRVVEVLQAVHLLLSFPVFVVLVAVDPRWLAQSLESEYKELLRTGGDDSVSGDGQAAPRDYLEKIFQIPFSVAPLDLTGRVRFVRGLLGDETEPVKPTLGRAPGTAPGDIPSDDAAALETAVRAEDGTAGLPAAVSADGETPGHSEAEAGRDAPSSSPQESAEEPQQDVGEDEHPTDHVVVDLSPGRLRFTAAELTFLQDLLPLLDTSPRSLKRYINIYRLIKVVARLSPDGEAHRAAAPQPHEGAMLLLAIQSGLPAAGPDLVARVGLATPCKPGETPQRLVDVVERLTADLPDGERHDELTTLRVWLDGRPATADWPAPDLAPYARHVRLYTFA